MRNKATVRILAAVCVAAIFAGGAEARKAEAGTNVGNVLRIGSGARGPAMGNAYAASATGVASLHYNPAGLGFSSRAEVGAMYQALILDVQQGEVGFSHPINSTTSWGVGIGYIDYGKTQRVSLADVLSNNSPSTTFTGRDLVAGLSVGKELGAAVSVGATGKFLSQEIDNVSGTAFAADFGVQFRPRDLPFPVRAGVTAQNIGSTVKFERAKEDLPFLVKGGLSIDLFNDHVTISADVEKVRNQEVTAGVGAEGRFMDMFALRVGYDGRIDADDGLTAGFGVKLSDLMMDYAYTPYGKLGNNHRLSLQYNFGPDYDYRR